LNDLLNLGSIRLAIQRDVNHKLGLKNIEDDLPKVFFKQSIQASGAKLDNAVINRGEFEKMKKSIIKRLMWRSNGGVDKSSKIWQQCQLEIKKVESMLSQL
jgi:aldehyde:ferredoxin oxidoreductase